MKMNYIINPARILNRFGKAWLIKRANGKHELERVVERVGS